MGVLILAAGFVGLSGFGAVGRGAGLGRGGILTAAFSGFDREGPGAMLDRATALWVVPISKNARLAERARIAGFGGIAQV